MDSRVAPTVKSLSGYVADITRGLVLGTTERCLA